MSGSPAGARSPSISQVSSGRSAHRTASVLGLGGFLPGVLIFGSRVSRWEQIFGWAGGFHRSTECTRQPQIRLILLHPQALPAKEGARAQKPRAIVAEPDCTGGKDHAGVRLAQGHRGAAEVAIPEHLHLWRCQNRHRSRKQKQERQSSTRTGAQSQAMASPAAFQLFQPRHARHSSRAIPSEKGDSAPPIAEGFAAILEPARVRKPDRALRPVPRPSGGLRP